MRAAPTVRGFGATGQASITQLFEVLSSYNPQMKLDWIPEAKHFKLTGYSHMTDDEISAIIAERRYAWWIPRITQRMTDGSIIVELMDRTTTNDKVESLIFTPYRNMSKSPSPTTQVAKKSFFGNLVEKLSLRKPVTNECRK